MLRADGRSVEFNPEVLLLQRICTRVMRLILKCGVEGRARDEHELRFLG